jgi:hypothetical protein
MESLKIHQSKSSPQISLSSLKNTQKHSEKEKGEGKFTQLLRAHTPGEPVEEAIFFWVSVGKIHQGLEVQEVLRRRSHFMDGGRRKW